MKKACFYAALLMCSAMAPVVASAQIDCSINQEMIFNMRDPGMGSFNLWDTLYGTQDTDERFRSAIILASGSTLAAGEENKSGGDAIELVLAEIDHRGRVTWKKNHVIPDLQNIQKIVNRGSGALVVGEVAGAGPSHIWIGVFDEKGEKQSEMTIASDTGAVHPQDIIALPQDKGYLIASNIETKTGGSFAQIYGIDETGNILFERAYRTGLDNALLSLTATPDGKFMGGGFVKSANGRLQGWIVSLDARGNIIWERPYPYGASAKITDVGLYDQSRLVVVGDTQAEGEKYNNGWIMMVNTTSGDAIWKRRYRSGNGWSGAGLMITGDKISALFNTAQSRNDRQDYARILTIDSRGLLLDSQGYFNGAGSHAAQMIEGKTGARIIIGNTDMVYTRERTAQEKAKGLKDAETTRGVDGWLVAGAETPSGLDRCSMIKTDKN